MKKAYLLLYVLAGIFGLYAQAEDFLKLRGDQITPEVIARVDAQNQQVRGPSFSFTSTPYNLPDAADIADPLTGRFREDITWTKDFTRHVNNTEGATLYMYYSNPEHFVVTQPDPTNPLKLQFQPIPTHWYGSELMVITVSDTPLGRDGRATATAIVRINVESVPDPPIFSGLPPANTFFVDEDDSLFVNFRNYVQCIDSSIYGFDLFVAQTQLSLPYNVNVEQYNPGDQNTQVPNGQLVKFRPIPDWPPPAVNGTVRFIVTAVDRTSNAFTAVEIFVTVIPENDPPVITGYLPATLDFTIDQNTTQNFSVTVVDPDMTPLAHTWLLEGLLNGVPFSNVVSTTTSLSYLFDVPGVYTLTYTVSDGWVQDTVQWTIHVRPIGPLFNPVGGVYDHSITVTLTPPAGFEGAVIYYTLDGSIPVPGAPGTLVYDQPIPITTLGNLENIKTIRAIYVHPDYPPSQVVSYTYRITGQVAGLVFNPVGGLYYSQISVNITCPNAGATIYYTTDGSDPIPGDPDTYEYTGPVVVGTGTSMVIKAIAVRADWIDSPTRTESYNVTGVVTIVNHQMSPPTLPDGEFYTVELGESMPVSVLNLIMAPPSATLYYTTDSSIPGPSNPSSIVYHPGDTIPLTCPTWITLRAYNTDWLPSTIYTYFYDVRTRTKIVSFANGTVFDPIPGTYTAPVMVTISTETIPANAPVYYTTNGEDPTDNPALLYTGPFMVSATTTVKAIARDPSICPSQIYTGHYVITGQLEMPQFSPPPSSYQEPLPITIYHEMPGTTIYYTLDGTDPDEFANLYSAPLNLPSGTHTIRARAYKTDWLPSHIRTGTFRFGYLPAPVFNLEGGVYTSPINVQLSVPVDGATILYTTTGGVPATLYTGAIPVGALQPETVTISAKAVKVGWADSDIVTRTFTVTGTVVTPTFTPPGSDGPFTSSINVTIATSTPGATIKYTLDGQDPTDTYGNIYAGPVAINQSATLKARAFLASWAPSAVRSDDYTILGNIATPVFTPGTGTYTAPVSVFISVNPPDAQIYYTEDGSIPTVATGIPYVPGSPVLVSSTRQLQAIAVKPGWNDSAIGSAMYTITGTVAAPVIAPPSGTYYSPQTVTIESATPGATIVYTTDGSIPSRTNGTIYGGPFVVSNGVVIVKAMAYLDTWADSPVTVATYVIVINPPVSSPLFSPAGGYYNSAISVTITAIPADATIYYTMDGTAPSASNGTEYTGPIAVSQHTLIRAIAVRTNWPDSSINSAEYYFLVANPVLSVPSGSYSSPQSVSMSVGTPGAQIRYTTDGTDPSPANGFVWDGTPLVVSNTTQATTVKAIAYLAGWVNSNIVSYTYVINPPVADPFFSVEGGDYYAVFNVSMSTLPANASIYYTTDGTDPSESNGTLYAGPVAINQTTTLKARAYMVNYPPSGIKTAVYNLYVSPVSFNPPGGTYNANQNVSLSTVTPGASIWYTTDGSDPIPGVSALYDQLNPILVDHNLTIKATASLANWFTSPITSAAYIIDIPLPDVANITILPPSGVYTEPVTVSMATGTPGAIIRYTTDGTEPTLAHGNTYSAPFTVSLNTTVAARAFLAGWDPSPIATAQYIIVIPIQTVATPTFAPPAGVYGAPVDVVISTATAGATIRYTTDGTEPSETIGTVYAAPVNIAATTTIKAIAYKTGMNTSQISNSSYVINIVIPTVEAPVFSIPSATYYVPQTLAISTATPGASIRYTTDGSDPSPISGTVYAGPINIPGNSTLFIKAIAYLDGWNPSPVVSANYIVTGTVADVVYSIPSGTYNTAQNLVLSTATEGTSIYYTTDGSDPTTASQYYYQAIPIPLNTVMTVKARGFKANWLPSSIGSETYNVTGTTAFNQPVLSPAPGTYSNAITVTIGTPIPPTADVYYTTDGTVPSASNGTLYSGAFGINSAQTIRAVAVKAGWQPAYISGLYEFQAATPVFAPPAGSYPNAQTVVLSSGTVGASIRHTTDGTDPSPTNGSIYSGPITVDVNQTIKAYAFLAGYQDSPIVSATYAIGTYIPVVATPVLNPVSGTYPTAQSVSITTTTPGAVIHYTTNGSDPTEASDVYLAPITVPLNTTTTIKAKAFKVDWMPSATAVEVYNITGTVMDVVFTPPAGNYTTAQNVVLSSATPGAYFRYTMDGSEPNDTSDLYTTPIPAPLNTVTTIKAKAYKAGWTPSATGTAVYNVTGTVVLPTPVFNPPAGIYSTPQTVSISTPVPSDATVRYTIDGSVPSPTNGIIYSGPVSITQTTTLQAIAYKAGWTNSTVASAQYNFGVSSPVFSPQSGTYPNALDVTITSATPGAQIRYTTDGTDPTPVLGTLYTGAIHIPENSLRFFKAIAFKEGWTSSIITSASYNVTGTVADIQFNPAPGTYDTAQTVFLSTATDGASIYYTTDGSEPTQASTAYTAGIVVPLNSVMTIRARGYKTNWLPGNIGIGVYNITGTTAFDQPVLTPAPGTYSNAINVTIGAPIPSDAQIWYTTDGSTPSATNGMLYGAPIAVDQALTIRAVALKAGWQPSYIMGSYAFAAAAPVFAPPAGSYASTQYVVLSSGTTGAQIRYTTDGTDPSPANGSVYSAPITVSINQTIKAYAFKAGYLDSPIVTATYAIGTYVPVVATPVFDPLPGTYPTAQNVGISTSTAGAVIRYTTDGSDPNATSNIYLTPINVPLNSTMVIKAIAYRDEWLPSQMAVGTYIITGTVADVIFTPAGGSYTTAQSVVLTSLTEGAYFRYTTDGSDPTATSTLYTTAIPVPANAVTTLKARAYKTNWLPSAIGTEVYNVTGQVSWNTPVFTPAGGTYATDQTVTIASPIPSDATVRYTIDGSVPSPTNGIIYSGPVSITQTTTLQAIAYKAGWTNSTVASAQYNFGVLAPVFDPAPGSYQTAINVTITTPTPGASIRFTTNGTDPSDSNGQIYTGPIAIPEDSVVLLKAVAYKAGWQNSPITMGSYNVYGTVTGVNFNPVGGTYQNPVSVILTCGTPGATIRYTTDGSEPSATSPAYVTAIVVPLNTTRTIKAKAYRSGWIPSATSQQTYVVTGQVTIADPVFSVPSGTYTTPLNVTINNPFPADATIYYTTDGSEPSQASSVFSAPIGIALNSSVTIKAIAYRNNWTPSPIYTAAYNTTGQVALPAIVFTPPAGTYQTAQTITINPPALPADATLRYTLDGSEPSLDSPAYLNPIYLPLNSITTIRVKGFRTDWIPSATASATYNITGQVAFNMPVFDPAPGIYTTAQNITVNTAIPAGATVYYTTDGSEPTQASQTYSTAIALPLDTTLTLKVKAFLAGWTPSDTYTGLYTTTGAVSLQLPVFTPAPGLYNTPQMVTLNTTTIPAGATMHYTLDGSDPSDQSPVYTEPIAVTTGQTVTIRVRGYLNNWLPSIIHTGVYTVTGQVSITGQVFTPAGGTYQTPQTVTLSTITAPAGATVRYTLDGSEPTETSTEYTGGTINLGLNTTTTIKVKAFKVNWIPSQTYTATYIITGQVTIAAPQFAPAAGTYQTAQSVTINSGTTPAGATIRYTTNGTDPTASSPVYSGTPIAVPLNTTMTIKARAFLTNWTPSDVYTAVYTVTGQVVLPTPMFTPPAGNYTSAQQVTLNTATTPAGATLRYTLDGSTPTLDSPAYSTGNPIPIPANTTTVLTVRGFLTNWTPSATTSATYNITGTASINTPWFSPEPGIYTTAIAVSIAPEGTFPTGATIRYTTNGTDPTATSPVYNPANPIQLGLNTTTTIKAKAFHPNWTESVTYTGNYTITGQLTIQSPQFSPAPGVYTGPTSVSIGAPLPSGVSAVIRYTTDGSDPTPTSPIYTVPLMIGQTTQIKARAYATNWEPSMAYLANYIITGQVTIPEPVFNPPSGTYATPQLLVLSTPEPAGAVLHYTLDGSEPTLSSPAYTQPIPLGLNQDITVKVIGFRTDWIPSGTYTAQYHMTGQVALNEPVFDPSPGVYTTAQDVEIVTFTLPAGGIIRYTTDGSDPAPDSPIYSGPIHIDLNTVRQIKVRGFLDGWTPSPVITGNYRVTGQVLLASSPFAPVPGTYTTAQSVILVNPVTLPATGYTLHYTTDGTEPTPTNGSVYSGQALLMPLNSYTELRIRGFAQDWVPSVTLTAVYNITGTLPDPVFDPIGGLYAEQQQVSITCAVDGATIRYTMDDSEPTESSPVLATGETITVPPYTQSLKITAKAFKPGWISNAGVAQTYTVLPLPIDVRAFTYSGYIRVLWNLEDQTRVLQGFNVYRRSLSEATFTKLNNILVPPSQKIGNDWYYDDYDISTNVSYEYRVTAVYDGVESLPSGTTVVVYQSQDLQVSDASCAYPNPATTSTRIKLVLTRNDNVSVAVSIYDFEGKKIKTLTVPSTDSNLIEIPWDLKNSDNKKVGRGTYFARIVANDGVNKAERIIKISVK